VVRKLLHKRKSALLLTLGSAVGFAVGGVIAWSLLRKQPTLVGMPTGADVIPQDAAITVAFTTDKSQWQQLRRFGTPESQAAFDKTLAELRDRLLIANGLNYPRDIQPWVGNEITAAVLLPPANVKAPKPQPYDPAALAAGDQSTVMVLPIADPTKAQEILTRPQVAANQDWVDRDYKGIKIREVHGQRAKAYAATVLDNRFVVAANDGKAIERVIDTFKGKPSVAQMPGYSQALSHIATTSPFMQLYVNLPAATTLTSSNTSQPIPPQLIGLLKPNQGLAATMSLESEGLRFQGVSWLAPNHKTRFKVQNSATRMPLLLPSDTLLAIAGGNLKQSWQTFSQPAEANEPSASAPGQMFNPDTMRRGVNSLTGLDLDQDIMSWMNGEFALALVSAPAAPPAASTPPSSSATPTTPAQGKNSRAGLLLLSQTSDRKAAEQTFKQLDDLMKTRYRFQVSETQIGGKPAINWVSPFTALNVTHGWLDGDVAFLAIGADLASTLVPAPTKPLNDNSFFHQTDSTDLKPNNGHFFLEVDRLINPDAKLPLPQLPAEHQSLLGAIRAIGLTSALQDGRTTRYDLHLVLRKGNAPQALPAPRLELPAKSTP